MKPTTDKRDVLIVTILTLVALALRLYQLGMKPLWPDEGTAWFLALGQVPHDAPIIYQYLYGWSIKLFGWNEFAGRFPEALLGTLSIPLFYAIGKKLAGNRAALLVAGLAVVSPYLITMSQDMRIYSTAGFLVLLFLYYFLGIVTSDNPPAYHWLGLLATGIIGQYSHCFFILVIGFLGLFLIWRKGIGAWRKGILYVLIMATVLITTLPQLQNTLAITGERQHLMAVDFDHLLLNLTRLARMSFSFLYGDAILDQVGRSPFGVNPSSPRLIIILLLSIIWLTLFIFGIAGLRRWIMNGGNKKLLAYLVAGMFISFNLLYLVVDVSSSAHLVFVYLPFIIIIAAGLDDLKRHHRTLLLVILALTTIYSCAAYYTSPLSPQDKTDWRSAGQMMNDQWSSGDAALVFGSRNVYYTLKFYFPNLERGVYYRPRHDPAYASDRSTAAWWNETTTVQKVDSLLVTHPRVWVVDPSGKRQPPLTSHENIPASYLDIPGPTHVYLVGDAGRNQPFIPQ